MKDEAAGMPIKECKGISKHTIKKDITMDDYRDTLFSSTDKSTL